jgi:biotin synthase
MTQTTKWNHENVSALFDLPFIRLLHQAQTIHQQHFNPDEMECCSLLSIKTGACPEDCGYCAQSGHYETGLTTEKLYDVATVIKHAKLAKETGAVRFCMGAAWKTPPKKQFPHVLKMVEAVKDLGLETCMTLGKLTEEEATQLKEAGLDYYNHNLDTSPEFYENIVTTRTYQDRLDTIKHVHEAGINICCGAILGMGESRDDHISFLLQLANLPSAPKSIPINQLKPFPGTPLENAPPIPLFDYIRVIAVARIMFPTSKIRLSCGRENMSDEAQTLCFIAGANSIFIGDKLLTSTNTAHAKDTALFEKLNIHACHST